MKIERRKEGFVLAAVLVVVMLSSMIAISLLYRMRAEQAGSVAALNSEQATAAAMSGVQQAIQLAVSQEQEPGTTPWLRDPTVLYHQFVTSDGSDQWFYTVYSRPEEEGETIRYGLTDEASKINLLKTDLDMLRKATGLPDPQLNALAMVAGAATNTLADFADPTIFFFGLEKPTTLDQLATLPGFSLGLIYGEDANLNFKLDPNEDDGEEQPPLDNKDGILDMGLRETLTLVSYEPNVNALGQDRVDINNPDAPWPGVNLPPQVAQYILAAQKNKVKFKHPAELLLAKAKLKGEDGKEVEMESGVDETVLGYVIDYFTADPSPQLKGLININTASAKVLQALPDIDEAVADAIISTRAGLTPEQRTSVAWLYQEKMITADTFKKIAPLITARATQFSFQVIGYGVPSGNFRRFEVKIDIARRNPRVISMRDLTRLGLPFELPSVDNSEENPKSLTRRGAEKSRFNFAKR